MACFVRLNRCVDSLLVPGRRDRPSEAAETERMLYQVDRGRHLYGPLSVDHSHSLPASFFPA